MKRIVTYFMLLAMLVSCFGGIVYAAETEVPEFTNQQFALLNAVGIVYGDSPSVIKPEKIMTRGEAAIYFSRMARLSSTVKAPESYEALFYDTTSENSNYKYIKACVEAGLLNGYPDGNFRPGNSINSKDAARVLLYAIGYKEFIAVTNIDYVINQTGIMDGVAVTDETNYGQFMKMAFNALHAPACVPRAFKGDDITYDIDKDVLVMEDKFNIVYKRGVVDGAAGTGLIRPDQTMLKNMISIDGVLYECDINSSDYIGYDVEFYYRNNVTNKMGNRKLIYAEISGRNKIVSIKADDAISFSNMTFTYSKGNDLKKLSITPRTNVIYNGIAYPMFNDSDFIPKSGSVTFVDNNGDGNYEVALINEYQYILVDSVDLKNKVIYDQNETDKINIKNADEVSITWTGEEIELERVLKGHFLKIKATKPESGYYSVNIELLKTERTNAEVESVKKETLKAGGAVYDLWSKLDADSKKYLTTGSYVTLYLDGNMVVRVTGGGDGTAYGYLADIDTDGTFVTTVKVMIIDAATAEPHVYKLNSKVMLDGATVNATAISTPLLSAANTQPEAFMRKGTIAQPIKFKLNAKGDVSSIDTHILGANEDPETSLRIDAYENAKYSSANSGFSNRESTLHLGSYKEKTPRLRIPDDPKDMEGYGVVNEMSTSSSFPGYKVAFCNRDKDNFFAEAVFMYLSDSDFDASKSVYRTPMLLVTDKITELNAEGEIVETVTCRGENQDYVFTNPQSEWARFTSFDVGDLVKFKTNVVGKISAVEMKFDASVGMPSDVASRIIKNEESTNGHIPLNYGYRAFWVTPLVVKDGVLRACMSSKSDAGGFDKNFYADNISYAGADIYQYKVDRGVVKLEPASISDIITNAMDSQNPSELMINVIGSKVRQIVIFE